MKQAKIALTAVAIMAVIGGALAFKSNRSPVYFYSLGATTIAGKATSACLVPVTLLKTPNANGVLTPYSSTFGNSIQTTTCQTKVIDFQ